MYDDSTIIYSIPMSMEALDLSQGIGSPFFRFWDTQIEYAKRAT